jgi:hypothetical protein
MVEVVKNDGVAKGGPETYTLGVMPLKAHVQNGRLVLDEPTDLPEGEVVYLEPVGGVLADDTDDLDDEDRVAPHAELDASIAEADEGKTEDFRGVLDELRQRP